MAKKKSALSGLTSDYAQNQRSAYASMTPAQRTDYQRRGAMLGVALPAAAAAFALSPVGATVGATLGTLSLLTAQRVIAPTKKTVKKVRGGAR
jgi:hypothetical protein